MRLPHLKRRTGQASSSLPHRIAKTALILAFLGGSGGCAALPLATIGSALDVASSAATSGSEVYSLGKLDDVFSADYDSCRRATILAAADLWLHMPINREKSAKKKIWVFRFTDDFGSKVNVTIEQRTQRLCRVRVDVGWFGSEPTAKLFMYRIRAHLPTGAGTAQMMRTS